MLRVSSPKYLIQRFTGILEGTMLRATLGLLCALLMTNSAKGQNFNSTWEASSHQFPDSICARWGFILDTDTEVPVLEGDTLVISSSSFSEGMIYWQTGAELDIQNTWIMEFVVKYISGSSNLETVAPIYIDFSRDTDNGNIFWIDQDRIFLWSGHHVMGATQNVDTDDAFHTYRIEFEGGGAIRVYYDDSLVLNGSMYSNPGYWVLGPRIVWGEGAANSQGVSKWLSFRHNAYALTTDFDGDAVYDSCDNCQFTFNPSQSDCDNDGIGDACESFVSGDADNSGSITISDAVYLINYIFSGGPAPCPLRNGDADCSGSVTISDAVYLIAYIFSGGPAPC